MDIESWPAENVQMRLVKELVPYAKNARVHTAEQISLIAGSIKEFGWTVPVLLSENNTIIAGHGRIMAASELGIKKVPAMVARGWSQTQMRAYVIADNRLTEMADWDDELLYGELADIQLDDDFDFDLTGFSLDDLGLMEDRQSDGPNEEADQTPEIQTDIISVEGDLWHLGDHKLICGDSTSADVVQKLLGGGKTSFKVTDPPYGVEYDANWRNEAARSSEGMGNRCLGAGAVGKVENDDNADWTEAWALFPGDVVYIWHAGVYASTVAQSLGACDFIIRSQIIWVKDNFAISRGHYHWQHEPCWYAIRKKQGATGHWNGDRTQTTLWQIPKPQKSETGHSTQKPIECMRRPILNNSKRGEAIYEPFCGSGTTLIACEMEGRKCYAIELNPAYIDLIIHRWQDYTGKQAVHAETGKTFEQISRERKP